MQLGADRAVDTNGDWDKELSNETIDLVIESVGEATWQRSLNQLKKGGTMVVFGASAGDEVNFNLREFFYGQYSLLGTTLGSIEEFHEMIAFIDKHEIRPVIDSVYPLSETNAALEKIKKGRQFGKIAIKIAE
ncbi:NADPH:quinone reductase-like Zn-dependent oxidoreductase [Scopulibacillus daqui]|uniref:NADPH:quinone reductase-like Zn-dependent oxidoreductase n=1 Tax=Scopulibacillus daqui TaxID=1469162 RepID=A0ABS2Q4X8_9BACL|nr:NADPH:quinone reductase-like Zn-dependent oxidoreductase [Scopulibacillus daqui]